MPYRYSKKQQQLARLLEFTASILLFPFIRVAKSGVPPKKFLLVEPFQMGDVLSLTPLYTHLIKESSKAEIYVLTKPGSGAVLHMDKRIKQVIAADFPWSDYGKKRNQLSRVWRVLKTSWQLRQYQFDIGLDTRGDIRSQILLVLAGCKMRVGYQNYLHSNIWIKGSLLTHRLPKSKHLHRYHWNLELLTLLGFPESDMVQIVFPTYQAGDLVYTSTHIVLHVGGGWEYKRWSETKWAELIGYLIEHRTENVYVIGGPGEREIVQRLETKTSQHPRLFFKTTSLTDLVTLVANCKLFIGLDSGPMNLAVCLNKPVIALFGPGDSDMWRPLSARSKFAHKKESFPCNPCLQISCAFASNNCMQQISRNDVTNLIKHLLS